MSYRSHSHHPEPGQPAESWAYEYPAAHPSDPRRSRPQAQQVQAQPVQSQRMPPRPHGKPHQTPHPDPQFRPKPQQFRPQQANAQQPQPNQPKPHKSRRRAGAGSADYTLVHGRRQVRLGPVAFWIVVGTLVVMAGWSIVTGTYFAFKDDVLKRLLARQAEMQYAYEDRIAELRAQVDRITSRQLLDQEQFEQKLDALVRRQSILEQRAATLSSLPDLTPTGSVQKPTRSGDARGRTDREARGESRLLPGLNLRSSAAMRGGVEGTLARMQDALDRLETKQAASLTALEESFESRARRLRSVLSDIGINPGKPLPVPPPAGVGGPYVPANAMSDEKSFERQLYRIHLSRSQVDRLTRTLQDVPVRMPVAGEVDMSSGFGTRMDPFLRSPAMHTGVDMRGTTGDPVRATANGKVSFAGANGGYGKMIEIEHRSGIATRYAHLSSIDVRVGQSVKIGQFIGKIGSTGRSTGPHLHYETRIDGDAVDPMRYLRAGTRLGMN